MNSPAPASRGVVHCRIIPLVGDTGGHLIRLEEPATARDGHTQAKLFWEIRIVLARLLLSCCYKRIDLLLRHDILEE